MSENTEEAPKLPKKRNKGGRPKGSKGKATLLKEMLDSPLLALSEDPGADLKAIYTTLVNEAKAGQSWAQNIYWNKVLANASDKEQVGGKGVVVQINISDMQPKTVEGQVIDG